MINWFKKLFREPSTLKPSEYEALICGLFTSEAGQRVLNYWLNEDWRLATNLAVEPLLFSEGRRSRLREIISIIDAVSKDMAKKSPTVNVQHEVKR
jgi:hypothetical protein